MGSNGSYNGGGGAEGDDDVSDADSLRSSASASSSSVVSSASSTTSTATGGSTASKTQSGEGLFAGVQLPKGKALARAQQKKRTNDVKGNSSNSEALYGNAKSTI